MKRWAEKGGGYVEIPDNIPDNGVEKFLESIPMPPSNESFPTTQKESQKTGFLSGLMDLVGSGKPRDEAGDVDKSQRLKAMIEGLGGTGPALAPIASKAAEENPRLAASSVAEAIPFAMSGGGSLPGRILGDFAINAGSGMARELINKKDTPNAIGTGLLEGGIGALADAAITGTTKGTGKLYGLAKPAISEGLSTIGSFISSIPKGDYQRATDLALDGGSLFGVSAKKDASRINELAKNAINAGKYYRSLFGKEVGEQKENIKKMSGIPSYDPTDMKNFVKSAIERSKTSAGNSAISAEDLELIDRYKYELSQKNLPIDEANRIKNEINSFLFQRKRASGVLSPGEGVLANLAGMIDDQVETKAPDLYSANKASSLAIEAQEFINSKLRDKNTRGTNLKSSVRLEKPVYDALSMVDEYSPNEYKFMEEVKDIIAREPFRAYLPGQGGGSGSAEGAGNIARGLAVKTSSQVSPELGALLSAVFSPVVNKAALKGIGATVRGAKKASRILNDMPIAPIAGRTLSGELVPNGDPYDVYMKRGNK
jgi:hypothetical protein